jgi:hypothetical protein
MGKHVPGATTAVLRQDGVDHFAHVDCAGATSTLGAGGRDHRFQDLPLLIRHIRGIRLVARSFLWHGGALLLDRGCANYLSKRIFYQDLFPDSLSEP